MKYKADLVLSIDGIEESVPVVIEYTYHRWESGHGISPDEPAHCEVQDIRVDSKDPGKSIDDAVDAALDRLMESTEFQGLLMEEVADSDARAEEFKAESASDDRLMGD